MATLMRCTRSVCTILEPALNLRISHRYVRSVRRRPPTTSSSSFFLKSGVKNEQIEGAERLDHACCPSTLESLSDQNLRDACQKHGDTTRKESESHPEKNTSKRPSPALISKLQSFHQMRSLRYEKAQPDDKRVS